MPDIRRPFLTKNVMTGKQIKMTKSNELIIMTCRSRSRRHSRRRPQAHNDTHTAQIERDDDFLPSPSSLFLSLPLSFSLFRCTYLYVFLTHYLLAYSICVCQSLSLSIFLCLPSAWFFSFSLFHSHSHLPHALSLSLSLCLNISLTNLPLDISYSLFQLVSINSLTQLVPRASQSYVHYFCLTHTGFWVSFFYTFTQALSHTKTFYSCAQRHVRLYLHRHYYYLSTCVCVSGWILQRVHAVLCVKTVRHIFWN